MPQPDGPMIAVTAFAGTARSTLVERAGLAIEEIEAADVDLGSDAVGYAGLVGAACARGLSIIGFPSRAKKRGR